MIIRNFKSIFCLATAFCLCVAMAVPSFAAYDLPLEPANKSAEGESIESIYLIHRNSGKVILSHNADTVRYVASTTKMMTALLLIESGYDLSTIITIPTELTQEFYDIQAENGADMQLEIGEEISMEELLYGLMVRSANDAASVIAYVLGDGDMDVFFDQMNERARELGCTQTNFTCAHGLYDAGNVSTAEDLALIGAMLIDNPDLLKVVNTQSYTIRANNAHDQERVLTSTNYLLDPESDYYRDYVDGIKTGFTDLAGRCIVTSAEQNGQEYILVILNSTKDDLYVEATTIFDWVFETFDTLPLLNVGQEMGTVTLTNSYDAESFTVLAPESISAYGHPDDEIDIDVTLVEEIKAPVTVGDKLGEVTVSLAGEEIATLPLTAPKSYEDKLAADLRNLIRVLPFIIVVVLVLMVISRVIAVKRKK